MIFAYGAYKYHREMLEQYEKVNKELDEKEKKDQKEGGEYEPPSFEGGSIIEMKTFANDYDDSFIKFA